MLEVIHSDALTALRTLPDESVQTCVTSPPYWGLRDYGLAPAVWDETVECQHEWEDLSYQIRSNDNKGNKGTEKQYTSPGSGGRDKPINHAFCHCGAWRGCLGLEPTPDLYINHLSQIFREVRRVLRKDGTLWLNLGDSYATGGGAVGRCPGGGEQGERFLRQGHINTQPNRMPIPGLKSKDLSMVPARAALALQSDGWYLRSEITWCKRAPMPESVTDRPTSATEKIYLLSKSEKYFYNNEAVRERYTDATITRVSQPTFETQTGGEKDPHNGNRSARKSLENLKARVDKQRGHSRRHAGFNDRWDAMSKEEQCASGANLRNYWVLGPDCFPEAHFATFPREVPRRCILLGSKAGDTILDPFAGSGTTGKVAIELGRKAILIEPKAEYVEMINKRCQTTIGLPLTYGATTRRAGSGDNGS